MQRLKITEDERSTKSTLTRKLTIEGERAQRQYSEENHEEDKGMPKLYSEGEAENEQYDGEPKPVPTRREDPEGDMAEEFGEEHEQYSM
jgi:hypothetical protein